MFPWGSFIIHSSVTTNYSTERTGKPSCPCDRTERKRVNKKSGHVTRGQSRWLLEGRTEQSSAAAYKRKLHCSVPVSYTHLDVYKRQVYYKLKFTLDYADKQMFMPRLVLMVTLWNHLLWLYENTQGSNVQTTIELCYVSVVPQRNLSCSTFINCTQTCTVKLWFPRLERLSKHGRPLDSQIDWFILASSFCILN